MAFNNEAQPKASKQAQAQSNNLFSNETILLS
jgi:hypothetical protein